MTEPNAVPAYDEIKVAFTQPGCPLCGLLDQAANMIIDSMLWELVNDPQNQDRIKQARGYCQRHGWMLVRGGAAMGITILMKSVIDTLLEVVDHHAGETSTGLSSHKLWHTLQLSHSTIKNTLVIELAPQTTCPVCIDIEQIGQNYINTLLESLTGPESLAEAFHQSDGLCLQHFRDALREGVPGEALDTLVSVQRDVWQRLSDELAEFIRKNDYRYANEPVGTEGNAWRRALAVTSGPPQKPVGQGGGLTGNRIR
jgi:hypothetical protein